MDLEGELTRRLEAVPEVLFALLFGSRGRGKGRPDSDLDVAVFLDPSLGAGERFRLRLAISAALEDLGRPDVVVLNDAPPLLAHRALQGRRLLVRDTGAWVRFFVRSMREAEDERYWAHLAATARRERIREGRYGRS